MVFAECQTTIPWVSWEAPRLHIYLPCARLSDRNQQALILLDPCLKIEGRSQIAEIPGDVCDAFTKLFGVIMGQDHVRVAKF